MKPFVLVAIAGLLLACGGGAAPTGTTPGPTSGNQATPTAGATAPASASAIPQPGGSVATVVLTGGPDAGTYTAAVDIAPNCSQGIVGPDGWGVQLSNLVAADNELGSIQLVSAAPGKADDENAFFRGTQFLITVTIGPSLGETSRNYEVGVYTDASDKETSGEGSAQVTDNGATAVIHATGPTADGVGIDATINCPSVVRA
jgi:hypothetical protein